jgi:hypothetical protein
MRHDQRQCTLMGRVVLFCRMLVLLFRRIAAFRLALQRIRRRQKRPLWGWRTFELLECRCVPSTLIVPSPTYPTIPAALAVAKDNDRILVGPGLYQGPIEITAKVDLLGAGAGQTIVQGSPTQKAPVVSEQGVVGNEISGFTFTGGLNGGVVLIDASPTLANDVIENNQRETTGAGIDVTGNSNPVILGCTIANNRHYQGGGHQGGYGGGIYYAAAPGGVFAWNVVAGNDAWYSGGAAFISNSSPLIHGNVFKDNVGDYSGGIVIAGGSPRLENNLLINNRHDFVGNWSAAINVLTGSPFIGFNTFDQNANDGVRVEAVGATAELVGNIIAHSAVAGVDALGPVRIERNDVWGNGMDYAGAYGTPDPGSISADPMLDTNFAPLPGSPVINAGPAGVLDLDGSPSDLGQTGGRGTAASGPYQVTTLLAPGGVTEHQFLKNGFHFETLLQKQTGEVVSRDHPDQGDPNAWGSSEYWNVYIAGGSPQQGKVTDLIAADGRVYARAQGAVTTASGTFGTWTMERGVSYDEQGQRVTGDGLLDVALDGPLSQAGGDLTASLTASNFLVDVPLQTGGSGNTGDMRQVLVGYGPEGAVHDFTWHPEQQPGDFPTDRTDSLSLNVVGEANAVDTVALGQPSQIAAASKPGLSLTLTAPLGPDLAFGGTFDTTKARDPFADNVGVIALVPEHATDTTQLLLRLESESTPGPPLAYADSYATDEDTSLKVAAPGVLTNDLAAMPAQLHATVVTGPSHGTVVLNTDGSFDYNPESDYFGVDGFSYTAGDGGPESAPQTARITVRPVNDAPTFHRGPDESVPVNAGSQTITGWATDISPGPANEAAQVLAFQVTDNSTPGLFSDTGQPAVSPDGTLTFTPRADASGTASITLVLKDDGGTANGGTDTSAPQVFTINVLKATPTVTWANPADITYGTALDATQLDATADVPGSFSYSPVAGTVLHAGDGQVLTATFTPTDTADYNTATASATINVLRATPTVTWANPADIAYGAALGSIQLDATADVPGTFAYSPAAGTALHAGSGQSLRVTFTPTDTADYNNATATATINVLKGTPAVTWDSPADITYGTALGATQLDASASVPGSFSYSPAAGTVLHAGNGQALDVIFTPTDTTDYNTVTASATINVLKATPVLTWPDPADIAYGTPLSSAQLDATGNVPGTFAYSPAAGTVLNAGNGQALNVIFTPADATDYNTAMATATINVRPITGPVTGLVSATLTPAPKSKKGKKGLIFTLTIENNAAGPLQGPLNVLLRNLKSTVKVKGAAGFVRVGRKRFPFVALNPSGGTLPPHLSASTMLTFSGKPNVIMPSVFAGTAPV